MLQMICNERGMICNVANLPPWGKVCNVADLPGKVCNVADFPGGRPATLQTFRGKVCKGEGLQYNTGFWSDHCILLGTVVI